MASLKVRIKITNKCTKDCWYCLSDERNDEVITEEMADFIIERMKKVYDEGNFKRVKFTLTGGDPFGTEKVLYVTEKIKSVFKGVQTLLVTDLCQTANLDIVKEYNKLGGLCMLSLNEDPIEDIMQIGLKVQRKNIFLYNVIMTEYNMRRMDEIVDKVIEYKFPLRLCHLFEPECKYTDIKEMVECADRVYTRLENSDFRYSEYNYPFNLMHRMKYKTDNYCGYGKDYFFIDLKGNIRRCMMEKAVAHIFDDDFQEKIKCEYKLPDKCYSCKHYDLCKGGCPYANSKNKYCELQYLVAEHMKKMEYRKAKDGISL